MGIFWMPLGIKSKNVFIIAILHLRVLFGCLSLEGLISDILYLSFQLIGYIIAFVCGNSLLDATILTLLPCPMSSSKGWVFMGDSVNPIFSINLGVEPGSLVLLRDIREVVKLIHINGIYIRNFYYYK